MTTGLQTVPIGGFTQESSWLPGNQAPGPITISEGHLVSRWLVARGLAAEEVSAAGHRWRAASQTICRAMEAQGSWARV